LWGVIGHELLAIASRRTGLLAHLCDYSSTIPSRRDARISCTSCISSRRLRFRPGRRRTCARRPSPAPAPRSPRHPCG
jgi:hypothetical protein